MYYVYHVPGLKIGCTEDPTTRARRPHYNGFEILETYNDGWLAGDRELELQAEYGYPIDTSHYMISAAAGKRGGKNSHRNGTTSKQRRQLESVRDPQKAADSRTMATCPHCNATYKKFNITRWHGDNCKHKPNE